MCKFLLLLATVVAMTHWATTANSKRAFVNDEKISFVDTIDDSEAIREKIRTEMDNYKRIKEMMFRKKLMEATTVKAAELETSSAVDITSEPPRAVLPDAIPASSEAPVVTSSEASIVTSSTIRQIVIDLIGEDEEEVVGLDETSTDSSGNSTKIDTGDRHIIKAPVICQPGSAVANGRCHVIINQG